MFATKNRLSKQKDFEKIFKNGKTINGGFFKIFYIKNSLNNNRFSIIVGKKISKIAVVRNHIKRLIRKEIEKYNFKSNNLDFIFIVFPIYKTKKFDIPNDIKTALAKIFIY